jgi:hypothetical protein
MADWRSSWEKRTGAEMPNRIIRDSCRSSETLDKIGPEAERLFWRLTTVADDFGRFEADPRLLIATCFPLRAHEYTCKQMLAWYGELERAGLVVCYDNGNGRRYGYFATWEKYQKRRSQHSKYPDPASTCEQMLADASTCEQMSSEKREARVEKREARSEDKDFAETPAVSTTPSPPIMIFPTDGPIKTWDLMPSSVAEWHVAFPNLDIESECRAALAWVNAKPERKKTARGMPAFLVGWLGRSQNRGPARAPTVSEAPAAGWLVAAESEWAWAIQWISRSGAGRPKEGHDIAESIIRDMGGWHVLGGGDERERPFKKREFLAKFKDSYGKQVR